MFKRGLTTAGSRISSSARPASFLFTHNTPASVIASRSWTNGPESSRMVEKSGGREMERQRPRNRDLFDWFLSDFPFSTTPREVRDPEAALLAWDLPFDTSRAATKWRPRVDIHENEKAVTVTAEVPGMKKEDIKVDVKDGALTIKGERKFEKKEQEAEFTRIERSYGSFQRRILLPDNIEANNIKASYEDGVLKIAIPKSEKAEGTVSVKID